MITASKATPRTESSNHPKAYSWIRAMVINFLPGVFTFATVVALRPLVESVGLPDAAAYTVAIALVTPMELAYLHLASRGASGQTRSIRSALSLLPTKPALSDLYVILACVAATACLAGLLDPLSTMAQQWADGLFPHAPRFELTDDDVAHYGRGVIAAVLLANLAIDALVNPFVEELYWKGHLLPRLPITGLARPLVAGSLFSLEHFWQPSDFLLVAVVQSTLCWIAIKRHSLTIPLGVHWIVNSLVNILLLAKLLT